MTGTIDAHAHLWDRRLFHYEWLDSERDLPESFLPADLLATDPTIEAFVFVQADCAEAEGFSEAAWVQSLAPATPGLAGIVAFAPLEQATAGRALDALSALPLVVGVRRLLQSEQESFFRSPTLSQGLEEVARRGWTFDACVRWHQLDALHSLAHSHEDLPIVLDHLGKPPIGGDSESFTRWHASMSRLAELPNITVKLSGLPAEAASGAPAESFSTWLRAAFDLFGPSRTMVGSDWPVSGRTPLTRGGWFQVVNEAIGATAAEWGEVSATTARRVYKQTAPSSPRAETPAPASSLEETV